LTWTPRRAGTYALPPPTRPNFGLSFSTAVNLTEMVTIQRGGACMTCSEAGGVIGCCVAERNTAGAREGGLDVG
jgi:hypothetical protein